VLVGQSRPWSCGQSRAAMLRSPAVQSLMDVNGRLSCQATADPTYNSHSSPQCSSVRLLRCGETCLGVIHFPSLAPEIWVREVGRGDTVVGGDCWEVVAAGLSTPARRSSMDAGRQSHRSVVSSTAGFAEMGATYERDEQTRCEPCRPLFGKACR